MMMDDVAGVPGISAQAMDAARGTLSGAIAAAQDLPAAEAGQLLTTARGAFVRAFEITSAIATVCALLAAVLSAWMLRDAKAEAQH
jgi:DHA2 family multidrug resistance protein-like MFS transporter